MSASALAQMQLALASRDDIADFRPEPIAERDVSAWIGDVMARAARVRERLRAERDRLSETDREMAERLLGGNARARRRAAGFPPRHARRAARSGRMAISISARC